MKLLIVVLIGFFVFSCEKPLFKSDELSLPKEDYNGNQLKLNGYYYDPYQVEDGSTYFDNYFFYRNGVILYGSTVPDSMLVDKEQEYMNGSFKSFAKDIKSYWGRFIIDGNIIKFERWYPSSGGPLRTGVREGVILNDTTFHITKSYRLQDGEQKDIIAVDETYHFKSLTPKPDSTNEFTN